MNPNSRLGSIYELINASGNASINMLAENFGVSSMTIRRDLQMLKNAGLIKTSYGKIEVVDNAKRETDYRLRAGQNSELKRLIAEKAASLLCDVDTLYADGSTSVNELLKLLPTDRRLTVFTNNFEAVGMLAGMKSVSVFVLGGRLYADVNCFDDDMAVSAARELYVDATFTSCCGFSPKGLFNNSIYGLKLRQTMMKNAGANYVLADHTKLNVTGIFLFQTWDNVEAIVTDQKPDPGFMQAMKKFNVSVIC